MDADALAIHHLDEVVDALNIPPAPAALPAADPFLAIIEQNQAAATFLQQLNTQLQPVVFPAVGQVPQLPLSQQNFFASVGRVTRQQLAILDYFMLPFNIPADADVTFAFLAAHVVWGLFQVLDVNNGSLTCRFLGQVGGNVAHAGPLQLYQQVSLLPPTHYLRPGMGYLAAFQHLIHAFQQAHQPAPAVALQPPPQPLAANDGLAIVQALALLNQNQRPPTVATGATLADHFRQAQLTAGMFDDQSRFRAVYFPDLAVDAPPVASDLRYNYALKAARLALAGPMSLSSVVPDPTEKQLFGLMTFDFGDGHSGKVSLADLHPAGGAVTSPTHIHHAFDLLAGFANRFFGPSAAAGINQLSFGLMAGLREFKNLSVAEGIRLANMQLQTVSSAFSPIPDRPIRDMFIELLTIKVEDDPRILRYLVSRVGLSTGASGGRAAKSGGSRLYPSVKSGGGTHSGNHQNRHHSASGTGRSTTSTRPIPVGAFTSYKEWKSAQPPLGPGDEPCHAFLNGRPPCANSAVCSGTGPDKVKRPHAFPPQTSQSQQDAFLAWVKSRPTSSGGKTSRG
jgi:hypothetical protein